MHNLKSREFSATFRSIRGSKSPILIFLFSLFFLACQDDNDAPTLPDLTTYLDRFEEEARQRGYNLELSDVDVAYVDEIEINGNTFCSFGYSNFNNTGTRRIEISTASSCGWMERSDIERENFFFHELGHAFLNRPNDESLLCDGSPLSIMNSFNTWNTYENEEERAYYISELIDRTAALDQCIDYEQGWVNDSVFYQFTPNDQSWVFTSWDGAYAGSVSTATGSTGGRISLALVPGSITEESGRWLRQINTPNIPECADVTFRVTMNSEELVGPGAAISIRAFHAPLGTEGAQTEEYLFLTTTETPVNGKLDNYVEELTIPCYSRSTTFIVLFLRLMAGTEGEVSFENIELVVQEG
ncbi:MAG: hypothetical protein AAF992_03855 [Bacteroidota bacterium]